MKTIEDVAKALLRESISFEYSKTHLRVKDVDFSEFMESASYHATTKKLVLMNSKYDEVSFEEFMNALFNY